MAEELKEFMKPATTLPVGFNGVFHFTNWSDQEFVGVWGKKEYHFPAKSTSPMLIPEHSPLEIQHIRKKFAKDLAEREFFKSQKYESLRAVEGPIEGGTITPRLASSLSANTYTDTDLIALIQRALEPLPVQEAFVAPIQGVSVEDKLTRNDDGELNTAAIKSDKDLEKLAKGETGMRERVLG